MGSGEEEEEDEEEGDEEDEGKEDEDEEEDEGKEDEDEEEDEGKEDEDEEEGSDELVDDDELSEDDEEGEEEDEGKEDEEEEDEEGELETLDELDEELLLGGFPSVGSNGPVQSLSYGQSVTPSRSLSTPSKHCGKGRANGAGREKRDSSIGGRSNAYTKRSFSTMATRASARTDRSCASESRAENPLSRPYSFCAAMPWRASTS